MEDVQVRQSSTSGHVGPGDFSITNLLGELQKDFGVPDFYVLNDRRRFSPAMFPTFSMSVELKTAM